jgi:hypothetical protein
VAQTNQGAQSLAWYHVDVTPFTKHPNKDVASFHANEGPTFSAQVQWQDAKRYGVLVGDIEDHWKVYWFDPGQIHLAGRSWLFRGGAVRIQLSDATEIETPSDRFMDQIGISR